MARDSYTLLRILSSLHLFQESLANIPQMSMPALPLDMLFRIADIVDLWGDGRTLAALSMTCYDLFVCTRYLLYKSPMTYINHKRHHPLAAQIKLYRTIMQIPDRALMVQDFTAMVMSTEDSTLTAVALSLMAFRAMCLMTNLESLAVEESMSSVLETLIANYASSSFLPKLTTICGTPSLVALLMPGRAIEGAVLLSDLKDEQISIDLGLKISRCSTLRVLKLKTESCEMFETMASALFAGASHLRMLQIEIEDDNEQTYAYFGSFTALRHLAPLQNLVALFLDIDLPTEALSMDDYTLATRLRGFFPHLTIFAVHDVWTGEGLDYQWLGGLSEDDPNKWEVVRSITES